jgi:phosphoribosylformylglycinamidine synthase
MDQAGFDTYDVHMTDLQAGRARLDMFTGFVACGGFSYGDTLGAGEGWARSVLFNPKLADQFASFFARPTCSRSASATAARCSPRSPR